MCSTVCYISHYSQNSLISTSKTLYQLTSTITNTNGQSNWVTEHRDSIWRGRQSLSDDEKEYDESKQNGDLQVDLLARFDGKEEAEKRHGVDEQTRED